MKLSVCVFVCSSIVIVLNDVKQWQSMTTARVRYISDCFQQIRQQDTQYIPHRQQIQRYNCNHISSQSSGKLLWLSFFYTNIYIFFLPFALMHLLLRSTIMFKCSIENLKAFPLHSSWFRITFSPSLDIFSLASSLVGTFG